MAAKARFDIPSQLPVVVARPIYAGVGVTDLVVQMVREAVAEVEKTVAGFDYQPQSLREQATKAVGARVDTLGKDAQARRRALEHGLADLQSGAKNVPVRLSQLVDDRVATAGETYSELVRRGETLIGRIRRQQSVRETTASAETTVAKAKTTRTQATTAAKKSAATANETARKSPAKSSAKATATSAQKTSTDAAQATTDAAAKVGD
jgi:hypothetical protein